jgi:hypothetical protein
MKKAHSSFGILILFIFIVLQNNPANCQWYGSILSTSISPEIISSNDTITIEIFCEFPTGSCQVDELTIEQNGNAFEVNAMHCLGMLYYVCSAVDVIEISPQAPGDYQLDFQLFSGSFINGNCYGYNFADFISIPFTVHPLPFLQCPEDFSVCFNDSSILLDGAVPPGGFYYGQGVSEGRFQPEIAGVGDHEITYNFTDPQTGVSNTCTFNITVLPLIPVEAPDDIVANSGDTPFILTDGIPAGGTFTGNGVFYNNEEYYFDPSTGAGVYTIDYCFSEPYTGCINCDQFLVMIDPDFIIEIPEGWSGISSYISPFDSALSDLCQPIADKLIILNTLCGCYLPGQGLNNLITWDDHSGYMVKVSKPANMPFFGDEVQDKTIYLEQGWNIIPVLCQMPVPVENLFSGFSGDQLIKEVAGSGVYWEFYGINTIGNFLPGKAYYAYSSSTGSITFPAKSGFVKFDKLDEIISVPLWNNVCQTPATHIVALTKEAMMPLLPDDIIGAFTSLGLCAGTVVYNGKETALTIHGDDVTTDITDGFVSNENISYRLYRPSASEIFDLDVEYDPALDNSGLFNINGMSAITGITITGVANPSVPEGGIHIYPNPSAGIFNILGLEFPAIVQVYDIYGKEIIEAGVKTDGQLDLSGQADGVYFVRISTETGSILKKILKE